MERVDRALLRLRRMWDAPSGIPHDGGVVEGSTLLVCLAISDATSEVGVSEVMNALGVAHSTASRLVARAAQVGMIERAASEADPRRASLTLTPAGTRLVLASRDYRAARLQDMLTGWPDHDIANLAELLTRFAQAAGQPPPRASRR
ncbi:MarR family winged helix-turn-helix transcriptional regulator [Micromonosporaceae bacterium Da 78-11]